MDYRSTRRMRASRSDHALTQEARIDALLKEMRPNLSTSRPLRVSDDDNSPPSPPNYDVIFPSKHAPPPYSQLFLRAAQSQWNVDREPAPAPSRPKVLSTLAINPTPMTNPYITPYERRRANIYLSVSPSQPVRKNVYIVPEKTMANDAMTSSFSLPDSSDENGALTPRNAPRQASFMAAMTRQSLCENEDDSTTTAMRCCVQEQPTPQVQRRLDAVDRNGADGVIARENRRTTVYGK
ncbi:hypothetical protein Y032_0008g90 [Ancylostoma ceylanicum]|uniref:Uncharacterized protein n=1 Tax=Ancylostoma ceylanicum TaxID=53326 RepID=A0A016VNG1_9BILA|nr:hypothetical protein Y032_0008g90 [Ancylostoma ceylanicum]